METLKSESSSDKISKKATQRFLIYDILVEYCGQTLTPDKVDEIYKRIDNEITEGSCSWAFE